MPDFFTLLLGVKDHGLLVTLLVCAIALVGFFMWREMRQFLNRHDERLEKIDTLEASIKDKGTVITRPDLAERLDAVENQLAAMSSDISENCDVRNCPVNTALQHVKADMDKFLQEMEKQGNVTRQITSELLGLIKTFITKNGKE